MPQRYVRVVTLWIHPGQEAAFEAFERDAARIMARHGGRIDRAVRLAQAGAGANEGAVEVHFVSFPDRQAFDSYGADSEIVARKDQRNAIIARTVAVDGREAGPY